MPPLYNKILAQLVKLLLTEILISLESSSQDRFRCKLII